MSRDPAVILAAIIAIGVVWDALMVGVLAALLRDALPSRPPRAAEPRASSGRRTSSARARSRRGGTAPARPARGATA